MLIVRDLELEQTKDTKNREIQYYFCLTKGKIFPSSLDIVLFFISLAK